jgi:hypothetical protein
VLNKKQILENEPIYKYTKKQFGINFLEKGEILFRSLYYYQNFYNETNPIIGDVNEGRIDFKIDNVPCVFHNGKEIPIINNSSKMYTKISDPICHYISCFSNSDNSRLYKDFEADCRVKIFDKSEFIKRLVNSSGYLKTACQKYYFAHGNINYRDLLPNNSFEYMSIPVAFYKNKCYDFQDEFRLWFYFPPIHNDTFHIKFQVPKEDTEIRGFYSEMLFKIGSIQDIAIIESI